MRVRLAGVDRKWWVLISVGMGKEGLNLPEFSKLLTLDIGWVPADLDQFRHRYLLSYTPRGVKRGGWHRLQVRVRQGGTTVRARPGYLGS